MKKLLTPEELQKVDSYYKSSFNDVYWKEMSEYYPDYNRDGTEARKASKYIANEMLDKIKTKYPELTDDDAILSYITPKILDSIT